MKIEGNTPNQQATGASWVNAARNDRAGRSSQASTGSDDQVALSDDAQLLSEAMRAAQGAPAIRHELVEQIRQKLAAGPVGNDMTRLADKLIDHLLGK